MAHTIAQKTVLIVGGGFAGIRCALDLDREKLPGVRIVLVSDKTHFEYHAALYRVVTGRSPLEVCIPLRDIFEGTAIEVVHDIVMTVSAEEKHAVGKSGSSYTFDYVVLALGSETTYMNIPGLKELSFGFKSISEALRLKRHIHELFASCEGAGHDAKVCATHIVVIGGGASGTELAGELACYTKVLAKRHNLKPSMVTIDLIEAASRLLPTLPEAMSKRAMRRLRHLGVNIFLNRTVVKEEVERVHLRDMELKTETVIWTAGVKCDGVYETISGLALDRKGRVSVDEHLRGRKAPDIFVLGDAAITPYSGMAQTALHDGSFVAEVIAALVEGNRLPVYKPHTPSYAIPIGPGWAAVMVGKVRIYGSIGWFLRRLADFRFFLSILPLTKAINAFRNGKTLCESCEICSLEEA